MALTYHEDVLGRPNALPPEHWAGGPLSPARLADVHERFLASPNDPLPAMVRQLVADSWRRSVALGVDPTRGEAPLAVAGDELEAYRETHPLAPMMPLIRRLLVEDAEEAGHIVAVGDAAGRLLWVEGQRGLRRQAEGMHFVEGALWSESGAGTNAPGTALAVDAPVQIFAEEHYGMSVQAWSCVAAPVHDPVTGAVLGVIDLTGGRDVAGPRTLALVRACATAVESGLALRIGAETSARQGRRRVLRSLPSGRRDADGRQIGLEVLGSDEGVWIDGDQRVRLSRRHTELVWLLASAPRGLTVQELDVALHETGEHLVTVRAEINRVRRTLGHDVLDSRPYRLTVPVTTDVELVRRRLADGDLTGALDRFTGPPMPLSEAPGVRAMSEEIVAELRQAVLDSADVTALSRWTSRPEGHDDARAWRALAATLPPAGPRRAMARAHVQRLERQNR